MTDPRGSVWDHDRGPAKSSGWPELFAETPNYRGLGKAVLGREVFRWHFGPMFFRGRLDGSARLVVVGQEGAQDESLSHRSFTGGTGARMQHFLGHVGVDRSYVFVNTFVYPIFGQYTADLRPLAQDRRSPIVVHRHRILDKLVAEGDVRLVVAVGRAAKESVATWVRAHGGVADADALHLATGGNLPAALRFLGVLHPGGATGSGAAAVKADFQRAAAQIRAWQAADPGWLPADPGASGDSGAPFAYRSAPLPYRDFPYGTCPRLGHGGTSSNRTDQQRGIQLFSAAGRYNAAGASLDYGDAPPGSAEGYADDPGDVPVEPPRGHPRRFDPGPPAAFRRLLLGAAPGLAWPDFAALGVRSHPSFGVGPLYRGRFSGVSLVVVADPAGHDDLFTARALCGEAGQRLQALLRAAGITARYLILRIVPVDIADLTAAKRAALVAHPAVQAIHRSILAKVAETNAGLAALLAVGQGARTLAPHVVPPGVPVLDLKAWGEAGVKASWQAALGALGTMAYTKDLANPSFQFDGGRGQVPREELPYGTPRWIGTSGDRARRPVDRSTGRLSGDYVKLFLPTWVAELAPPPLTPAEQAAAEQLRL